MATYVYKPCQDCGTLCKVRNSSVAHFQRCKACGKKRDLQRDSERRRQRKAAEREERKGVPNTEPSDDILWRMVSAPDMDDWGPSPQFPRPQIELGAKLGSIMQGSKFVKVTQPSVVGVVKGRKLVLI